MSGRLSTCACLLSAYSPNHVQWCIWKEAEGATSEEAASWLESRTIKGTNVTAAHLVVSSKTISTVPPPAA